MKEHTESSAEPDYATISSESDDVQLDSRYTTAGRPVHRLPITTLRPADSPRLVGENAEHIRVLAEPDKVLPPILVHRPTMRVIDGMHRLGAARMRGQDIIDVVFFDGSDADAFVMAVRANVTHGLPLSYADREAAAERIVESHPEWSDRTIAAATGLAPRTVAVVRSRVTDHSRGASRVGRDGRVRPLDSSDGRREASRLIAAFPDASLRQIARAAGISPATVRDVRERVQRGEDPAPPRRARKHRETRRHTGDAVKDPIEGLTKNECDLILHNLERDPALRFAESGNRVLRWLVRRLVVKEEWGGIVGTIPPHSVYILAGLARRCANEWLEFAKELEQRVGR